MIAPRSLDRRALRDIPLVVAALVHGCDGDRAQPRQGDVLVQWKSASAPVLTPGRPLAVTASSGFLRSRPDRAESRDGRRASDARGSRLPEATGDPRASSMSSHRAMTLTALRPMPLSNAPPTRRVCASTGVKSARCESGVLAVVMGKAPSPQWEVAANRAGGRSPRDQLMQRRPLCRRRGRKRLPPGACGR